MSVVAFRSEISEPAPKLDSQVDVYKFPLGGGRRLRITAAQLINMSSRETKNEDLGRQETLQRT